MKNILVTGSSGYIGSGFKKYLEKSNFDELNLHTLNRSGKSDYNLDLNDKDKLSEILFKIKPNYILHLAAFVNPKMNEENHEKSKNDNFLATKNLVDSIRDYNPTLIFTSTDKVYDGLNPKPRENECLNPTFMYGKMKLEAENYIKKHIKKHFIFRVPIVHGFGETDSSFIDKSINDLISGKKVKSFSNVYRCYILLEDLYKLFILSLSSNDYGIYNCGTDAASYYKRIQILCKKINLNTTNLFDEKGNVSPLIQDLNRDKISQYFNISFY